MGNAKDFGERFFVLNRHAHGRPGWAFKLGPLRLLWWRHDPPAWRIGPGKLYLVSGSIGRIELLFWDRGLC